MTNFAWKMNDVKPHIAIVDCNTLAALGLKQLLQAFMPAVVVDTFSSFSSLEASPAESYVHFFVAADMVRDNIDFFRNRRQKTIVLAPAEEKETGEMSQIHTLCTHAPEKELVRELIGLQQFAHKGGHNLPRNMREHSRRLTNREAEVLVLIVKGLINKEIAARLNIALATVITHRKNIMEKLGVKSVSALTIYAVTNGYIEMSEV